MYPTRDVHFHRATNRRLNSDSRVKVYGNDTGSLLVQHSYPELVNLQSAHPSHSNNYSRHSPHKPDLAVWKAINIKQYNITKKIGSGTYGSVFHALSPCRGEVAIKQLCPMHNEKTSQDGFHITAIREIKILKALDHTNIISLHDVLCCKENVMAEFIANDTSNSSKHSKYKPNGRMQTYMVFEYMHHDLSGLLHNEHVHFTIEHIKYFMCQLFNALQYCHDIAHILHRDIKSSNLLVDNNGVLKIADFGLARQFIPALSADCRTIASTHASVNHKHPRHYTNRVVTLWYRAPELLLSDVHYTPAVDLWSVGCVFAELLFNKPIFTGKNEMEQWFQIIEVCGWNVAKESEWTSTLRDKDGLIATMKKRSKTFDRKLKTKFQHFTNPHLQDGRKNAKYLDNDGFALLEQLLTVNPKRRISAKEGSTAKWFRNSPYPSPPKLGAYQSSHDYEQRQLRKNPNYKANHFNNNGNHRNNNNSYNNGNNGGKARYSYSYNGVASNKVNGTMNGHSTSMTNTNNNLNRLNGNQYRQNSRGARDRSRSRSRERKGPRTAIPGGDSRSGSAFDVKRSGTHSKEGSVTLPPPIKRLQPLHTASNVVNPLNGVNGAISNKPMVVTLQAPTMKMNINRPNPVVAGNGRNAGFNGNNNVRNGFKPWNNNNNNKFESKGAAFYSRYKKPDELKGRSRF